MDSVWEKMFASRSWGKYPAEDLIRTVMRSYKSRDLSSVKVLEVGCGAGANLSFFLNEGFQVYGVDGAPSAIERAKARLGGLRGDGQVLDLRVQDFTQLPFEDESFDLVVDYLAVYANQWRDIVKTFKECFRVLKKGGNLYSRCWSTECVGFDSGELFEPGTSENPTEGPCASMGTSHFFSEEELEQLFLRFSDCRIRKVTMGDLGASEAEVEWIIWATK